MLQDCQEQGKEILINRALSTQTGGTHCLYAANILSEGIFKQAFWQMEADDYGYLRMQPELPAFKATFLGEGSEDVGMLIFISRTYLF